MTDDDEPLPALIQKLSEEKEAKRLASENSNGEGSLESIWARATEKKGEEEKRKSKPKRQGEF